MSAPLTLKYRDETDRAFGLAGMATAVLVLRRWDYLDGVDLDALPDQGLRFIPAFFECDNQTLSAKALWRRSYHRFDFGLNMLITNVLARGIVRDGLRRLEGPLTALMLQQALLEGERSCDLDDDEVRYIFQKNLSEMSQIFAVPSVAHCVSALASDITRSRRLDRDRLMDHLQILCS